jgi:hypothetical protein
MVVMVMVGEAVLTEWCRVLTAEDYSEEVGRNDWTEVVVYAPKRSSKVECVRNAGLDDGFYVAVEGFQGGRRLEGSKVQREVKEVPVVHHHVRSCFMEFCDLGEEMGVLEGGGVKRVSTMQVLIVKQPDHVALIMEALSEQVLLMLERQEGVNPFNYKETFEKRVG